MTKYDVTKYEPLLSAHAMLGQMAPRHLDQLVYDLEDAAAELDNRGWTRGMLSDETGSVCAFGAVRVAIMGDPERSPRQGSSPTSQDFREDAAMAAIATVVKAEGRSDARGSRGAIDLVTDFNDFGARSKAEVVAVIRRAARWARHMAGLRRTNPPKERS